MTNGRPRDLKARVSYGSLLHTYLRPQWRSVLVLGLLLAVGIASQLANPQVLRLFIDTATGSGDPGLLTRLAIGFLALAVLSQAVAVAETYVAENIGQIATNDIRVDLTLHCLELDLGFHNARTPGELIERVDGDVATLANFFSRLVVQVVGNAILMVAMLALLFGVLPIIGAAVTAFSIFSLFILSQFRRVGAPRWAASRQASAELFGFIEERLNGTEDIRSSGATDHTLRRLGERSWKLYRTERIAAAIGAATGNLANLLLAVTSVIGLTLGALAYSAGAISIGAVYLVFSYTQLLGRPIEQITRQLQDLQKATASLGRIRALFAIESALDPRGQKALPLGALGVELENVSFGYGSDDGVLRRVSLAIRPGEVVGLLGATGSGKTTLGRLIARFYDPTSGWIRVGGVDVRDASLDDLRRSVGLVTQEIQLFHASVRDNLALYDASIPDARMWSVLAKLGLEDWCRGLPEGLDTRLAAGGGGLSAGEAQLLVFARVFLRDPGLVILDEASSRMDSATTRQIERALNELLAGRTTIVIAHRLETVQRADTIAILQDGAIQEYGPREQLARDPNSQFARLLRAGLEGVLA